MKLLFSFRAIMTFKILQITPHWQRYLIVSSKNQMVQSLTVGDHLIEK